MERGHRTTSTEGEPGELKTEVLWIDAQGEEVNIKLKGKRQCPMQENSFVHLHEQCAVVDVERGRWVIWEDMCIQK